MLQSSIYNPTYYDYNNLQANRLDVLVCIKLDAEKSKKPPVIHTFWKEKFTPLVMK